MYPWPRYTRWREWCGNLLDKSLETPETDRHLHLQLPCAVWVWTNKLEVLANMFKCWKCNVFELKSHHKEGIANPETSPSDWALWDSYILTVYGDGHRWCFTHGTTADVWFYLSLLHRHHGNWCSGGQPIGFVIAAGIVAYVPRIAVQEGHGVKTGETWAG